MNIGAFPSSPIATHHPRGQPPPPSGSHITATNLARLLSRLDQKLGFASPSNGSAPPPPPSSLECAKIAAVCSPLPKLPSSADHRQNLEYARNLLLTLEKETESIRNHSQRQDMLVKLTQHKQAVRRLNEKLQTGAHGAEDEDEDETDHEMDVLDSDEGDSSDSAVVVGAPPLAYLPEGPVEYEPPAEASILRNRFPTQQEARTALFNSRGEESTDPSEKQLDAQRAEQEDLTADMLALAHALKQNSLRFSEELQKEKGLLDLATEGLDKNVLGIEGAGRKMGQLRRDESVGWLWGMLYPVIIVVLVCCLWG